MALKKQPDASPDIVTNLEYKQQQEFFEVIYEYFREYQENYAEFYTNEKAGITVFKSLIKLVSASKAQIAKNVDMTEIESDMENVAKLLKGTEPTETRKAINELSTKVFGAFEKLGISPTIHEEQDKLSKFWRDEEHAGLREMKKAFFDSFMLQEE